MNGHVFECYDEQTDRCQFARTIEELHGYINKKLKFYEDIVPLFATDMAEPAVRRPVAPEKVKVGEEMKMDETDELIWREELKAYVQRGQVLTGKLAAVHSVIWGHQCSEAMKAKVKAARITTRKREIATAFGCSSKSRP